MLRDVVQGDRDEMLNLVLGCIQGLSFWHEGEHGGVWALGMGTKHLQAYSGA